MRLTCPTCKRNEEVPEDFRWRPFCSRRCKLIDLGNWLDELYRIPADRIDDEGEANAPD